MNEVYKLVDNLERGAKDKDWNIIWNIDVSERCRSFVWLLKHDRILTKFSKSGKGLSMLVVSYMAMLVKLPCIL